MAKVPPIHKIVVIGSGGVGKSALTLRYMYDEFNEEYNPSRIGQFKKDTHTHAGQDCTIDILDTAGEEDLLANLRQYYSVGEGFLFVFAINDIDSLYRVKELYEDVVLTKGELESDGQSSFDMVLIGNKSDLEIDRQVLAVEGENLAERWNCEYIETSAKSGEFVVEAFQRILGKVQERKFRVPSPEAKKTKKKRKFKLKAKCTLL